MLGRIAKPPTYQKYWLCEDREIERDNQDFSYLTETGRESRVMDFIRFQPGATVLDVGCCYGLFSFWMANQGYQVTGIDKDPEVIDWCKEYGGIARFSKDNPRFEVADLANYHGQFDIVLSLALIHHLWRQHGLFKAMTLLASLVAPGGVLYLEWISDMNKQNEKHICHLVTAGRGFFSNMEILGITRNVKNAFRFMVRFTK